MSLCFRNDNAGESCNELRKNTSSNADISTPWEDHLKNNDSAVCEMPKDRVENNEMALPTPPKFQKGVLRTNCIDCLDRTNVAQFAYGLAALGHQLHALGFTDVPKIDLDSPLADDLMNVYEMMGDTLAFQYGGSAAHNKVYLWISAFSCYQCCSSDYLLKSNVANNWLVLLCGYFAKFLYICLHICLTSQYITSLSDLFCIWYQIWNFLTFLHCKMVS